MELVLKGINRPFAVEYEGNEFQTLAVMKQLARAHRYLGVLNGLCSSIPNESILINTLSLQEAKERKNEIKSPESKKPDSSGGFNI